MNRYYYTFKDMVDMIGVPQLNTNYEINKTFKVNNVNALQYIIQTIFSVIGTSEDNWTSDIANTLWCSHLVPRYYDKYVVYIDSDSQPTEVEIINVYKSWLRLFLNTLNSTYDNYKTLINVYQSNINNLMDEVKAYNRFNDTPQNGGSFSADTYTTTYTESGSQMTTKIARIDEIRRLMFNVYEDWLEEFRGRFIYD